MTSAYFERTSAQKAEVAGYRLEVNPDGEPLTPLRELVNQMPVGWVFYTCRSGDAAGELSAAPLLSPPPTAAWYDTGRSLLETDRPRSAEKREVVEG